jgi:PKD domain
MIIKLFFMKKWGSFFIMLLAIATGIFSCQKEIKCENCSASPSGSTNKSPIANAGQDQIIFLPIDSVMLDGSNSFDPDGTIISFEWSKISGPQSFFINSAAIARTVVRNLASGTYQLELKVTDNSGLTAKDTVQVVVNDSGQPNRPPVANAGADQAITLPTSTVALNGNGSVDPDNNINSYSWTKISGPASFTITNGNEVLTQVTNLLEGIYQFELKVTDAGGLFDKDTVIITASQPPGGNVNFFFPDPSGSVPPYSMWFSPTVSLVIVKITNYTDGVIQGVWCNSCSPRCPINTDYNADPETYTSFSLPAGTYSWTAETVVTNLTGYPAPTAFKEFMATPHSTQGTVTIQPNDDCVNIRIVF